MVDRKHFEVKIVIIADKIFHCPVPEDIQKHVTSLFVQTNKTAI